MSPLEAQIGGDHGGDPFEFRHFGLGWCTNPQVDKDENLGADGGGNGLDTGLFFARVTFFPGKQIQWLHASKSCWSRHRRTTKSTEPSRRSRSFHFSSSEPETVVALAGDTFKHVWRNVQQVLRTLPRPKRSLTILHTCNTGDTEG